MGIAELFEMGFFEAFWNWSNLILTMLVFSFVIIGVVLQLILQNKSRKPEMKWLPVVICGVGIIFSECVWHAIVGWERFILDIIYCFIVCVMSGAMITKMILALKNRH